MSQRTVAGLRSETEQAARLGIALRTLRRWREIKYGPAPTQIGRFFYYSDDAERAFIASCEKPLARQTGRRRAA